MNEEAAAKPLSEVDRLTGVLFDPKPAFADVASRPTRWWVPLLLLTALVVGYTFAYSEQVGWERFMREQIESNPRTQDLPAEQREQIIAQQVRWAPVFGYVFGGISWTVITLVTAGAFLFVFNGVLGTRMVFRQVYAITCYGFLPQAVGAVLAIVVLFLKDPAEFDLQNPVASNLAAFLDPNTTAKWVVSLAGSMDLFSVWTLLLLATGFSVAAPKLSWSKCLTWVGATWVVWLVVKTGWVWIWS